MFRCPDVSIMTVFISRMARTRRSRTWPRRRRTVLLLRVVVMMMMKRSALWTQTSWRRAEPRRKGAQPSPGQRRRGSITRIWRVGQTLPPPCTPNTSLSLSRHSHLLRFLLSATRGQECPELRPAAQEPAVLRRRPLSAVGAAAGVTSAPPSNQQCRHFKSRSNININININNPQLAVHYHPSVALFAKTILQVRARLPGHVTRSPPVRWALLKRAVSSSGGRHRVLWGPAAGLHPHPLPGPLRLPQPQRAERQK